MSASPADVKGEIVILTEVHVKPEVGAAVAVEWIEKFKAGAATEPGTLEYSWAKKAPASADPEDVKAVEGVYVVWERYRDLEALNAHWASEVIKEGEKAGLLVKHPVIQFHHGDLKAGW